MHFSVSYGTDQLSIHLHLVQDISAEGVPLQRQDGPSPVSDATVDCVWACFQYSPQILMSPGGSV